jgi:hypothetical protein
MIKLIIALEDGMNMGLISLKKHSLTRTQFKQLADFPSLPGARTWKDADWRPASEVSADTRTSAGRMVMQMLGSFAEFELSMVRERGPGQLGQRIPMILGRNLGRSYSWHAWL